MALFDSLSSDSVTLFNEIYENEFEDLYDAIYSLKDATLALNEYGVALSDMEFKKATNTWSIYLKLYGEMVEAEYQMDTSLANLIDAIIEDL